MGVIRYCCSYGSYKIYSYTTCTFYYYILLANVHKTFGKVSEEDFWESFIIENRLLGRFHRDSFKTERLFA